MFIYLLFTLSQSFASWWEYNQAMDGTIYTWHLGSIWFFGLVYNKERLRGYFRMSCPLSDATNVTIWTPRKDVKVTKTEGHEKMDKALTLPSRCCDKFFSLIFAAPPLQPDHKKLGFITNIEVQIRPDGGRFFDFELRRFIYDSNLESFLPGKATSLGSTFAALCGGIDGLSSAEAESVEAAVGPNLIEIPVPTWLQAIGHEFSKGFYVYQLFILLPWFFFDYYHMGLLTW